MFFILNFKLCFPKKILSQTLLPHRAGKLVMDKWSRSLNPIYCTDPFTNEEDEKLLTILKGKQIDWKRVSDMLPLRHPKSLMTRYVDLTAKEHSINKVHDGFVPV